MIYHKIESENPEHHWNYLEVNGQTVLDLGCGEHLLEPQWKTTPEYFLDKGAKFVIGVDTERGDIDRFNQRVPKDKGIFFCDAIDSTPKLERYLLDYNVTSLKMDIEGSEHTFLTSENPFPSLKHVAIETHSRELFHDIIFKLLSMQFKIKVLATFYPRVYGICNLIVASRD